MARRIAATVAGLGLQRFSLEYSAGLLPHAAMMCSIELYGRCVVPMVYNMLAGAGQDVALAVSGME